MVLYRHSLVDWDIHLCNVCIAQVKDLVEETRRQMFTHATTTNLQASETNELRRKACAPCMLTHCTSLADTELCLVPLPHQQNAVAYKVVNHLILIALGTISKLMTSHGCSSEPVIFLCTASLDRACHCQLGNSEEGCCACAESSQYRASQGNAGS